MNNIVPRFRPEINVTVQTEEDETYLILNDPFGFADGPIMVHADMVDILESCDGVTTWDELATAAGVEADGPEIFKVKTFIGQLSKMGYLDSAEGDQRRAEALRHWNELTVRPAVCAGSTYPTDADELRSFLNELIPFQNIKPSSLKPVAVLAPHIDYRVAPDAYAPGFNALRESDADLVVMIGTSHYWAEDRVILTNKHFETPLGIVQTDQPIVNALRSAIGNDVSDLAHKPEHSLELHILGLQHVFADRKFTIVPILVTGIGGEEDPDGYHDLRLISDLIHDVVSKSGRKAMYLISGDMAHIGKKFGDEGSSLSLLGETQKFDRDLLNILEGADPAAVHSFVEAHDNRYRICGHAPAVLGLQAASLSAGPLFGSILGYDVWNEVETESSVTFATVVWGSA